MQVGMMEQVLAPGAEHGEKADLSIQVLGIGGDGVHTGDRFSHYCLCSFRQRAGGRLTSSFAWQQA